VPKVLILYNKIMKRLVYLNCRKICFVFFVILSVLITGIYRYSFSKSENFYEALFYEKLKDKKVKCNLCPNFCIIKENEYGKCKARKNIDGKLYSMVYGKIAAMHIDPIEKKPFFHFLPGSLIYSISTTGCNMRCKFCQNWEISQVYPDEIETKFFSPEDLIKDIKSKQIKAIAFTYGEPSIFYEYMLDIAKLAKKNGIKTAVVSAGYINSEPLKKLLPYIDAYKIDLKGFTDKFYEELTSGKLQPVLETMKIIKKSGVWLEIVNLIIPGYNDDEEDIKRMAQWIKENLGDDVPLHFTRFYPNYKLLNLPPTPPQTLKKAREIAMGVGLKYVYTGNIDDIEGSTTYCPKSKQPAIIRNGFFVIKNNLKEGGTCPDGSKIPGIWK
jgi:pyruvate formate lyase activating enzyme